MEFNLIQLILQLELDYDERTLEMMQTENSNISTVYLIYDNYFFGTLE
jgi:hypothetical protein